jgi:hypothetical protein
MIGKNRLAPPKTIAAEQPLFQLSDGMTMPYRKPF